MLKIMDETFSDKINLDELYVRRNELEDNKEKVYNEYSRLLENLDQSYKILDLSLNCLNSKLKLPNDVKPEYPKI